MADGRAHEYNHWDTAAMMSTPHTAYDTALTALPILAE